MFSGSSNGHSPVLNLSKTVGSGSVGEQSGSEAGASHRSQDDEEEDDNLSEDLEDDNEKDEGMFLILFGERSDSFAKRDSNAIRVARYIISLIKRRARRRLFASQSIKMRSLAFDVRRKSKGRFRVEKQKRKEKENEKRFVLVK